MGHKSSVCVWEGQQAHRWFLLKKKMYLFDCARSYLQHVGLVSWLGIIFGPFALGAWSRSHWTTREVPIVPRSMKPVLHTSMQAIILNNKWNESYQVKSPWAFQVALVVKSLPANAGDVRGVGSIPRWGRSLGGGHGNPLHCSCPEKPMDSGAWWATVHGTAKSQTWLKWLSPQQYHLMDSFREEKWSLLWLPFENHDAVMINIMKPKS